MRALQRGMTKSFVLHACNTCGGVWLDAHAAAHVLRDISEAPGNHPPALLCPCCDRGMPPVWVPEAQVMVDRCAEHGVWFDHSELDAICRAAASRKGVSLDALPSVGIGAAVGAGAVVAAAAASAAAAYAVADAQKPRSTMSAGDVAGEVLLEMPETVYFGAEAAVDAAADVAVGAGVEIGAGVRGLGETAGDAAVSATEAASDVAAGAAEVASSAAEVAADVGSGFLEAVTGVFGALFD